MSKPKLSGTSKMPCKSWSLPAWETCPSAKGTDGKPVDACSNCYALQGAYQWKLDTWVDDMIILITKEGKRNKKNLFRWFDSGDVYKKELALKIEQVIKGTPQVKHWIPTRQYKDKNVRPVLDRINQLPNAVARYSSDSVNGKMLDSDFNSTIAQHADDIKSSKGVLVCGAYSRGGECQDCKACWDKRINTIVYPLHGNKVNAKQFTV
jgi:hypothetical protein